MQGPGSGQPYRISDNKSGYPAVSPDGRWIAFTIFEENGGYSNQVVRPDGSDLHYLYPELREDHPFVVATDWSRDGRKIVYHTMIDDEWFLGVITVDPESGTATGMGLIGLKGAIPFWSPDGTHLVYHLAEDGQPDLGVSSVDGKDKYRLTDDPAAEWLAGWSENPSFIYYGRMMENGHKEVYRIAMDDNGRPKSQPELWMVFPPPVMLRQFMDFHTNRALGAVYEAESDIVLLEFEDPPSR
jgi:Tol biopolymer transport system component